MNEKIQQKLEELKNLYTKNLPGKITAIQKLWEGQSTYWNLEKFQELHREVHSLCGSAGTYGYPKLSHNARQMEIFLKSILNKESINDEDKKLITHYLDQLTLVTHSEKPEHEQIEDQVESVDNKLIYIVEQDEVLAQSIRDNLSQIGFIAEILNDLTALTHAVRHQLPSAMIIDTYYLDSTGAKLLQELQNDQATLIHLFCILPNSDLIPRLVAYRAGCDVFFQKPIDINQLSQEVNHKCGVTSGQPYRILIVDDSKSLADYYALILNQAGMTAKAITNPLDLLVELETFQPNLLLMDVYMPECSGFELAAILRREAKYTKIPIIFLSTEENKDKKLFAISLGGDDFLTKPISPQHLISAVRSRSKRASILNYYMITDSLTGLLNHSSILKQLESQLNRCQMASQPLSVVMIDIDRFKKVNDKYGHQVGDEVIKKLSALLSSRLRNQDVVGRYGGEEFVLILPTACIENAMKIVDNLRVQFSELVFKTNGAAFSATFSAGIASFNGLNSASELIKQADHALYKAKKLGRNQVVLF